MPCLSDEIMSLIKSILVNSVWSPTPKQAKVSVNTPNFPVVCTFIYLVTEILTFLNHIDRHNYLDILNKIQSDIDIEIGPLSHLPVI